MAEPDSGGGESRAMDAETTSLTPVRLTWALGDMWLERDALVLGMNIQEGVFRKKKSYTERRIAFDTIDFVMVRESDRALEVHFMDDSFEGFQRCESLALLSRLIEQLPDTVRVEAEVEQTDSVFDAIGVSRPRGSGQVRVKSYRNEKEFERDASSMVRQGWSIAGQSSKERKTAILRTTAKTAATGLIGLAVLGRSRKGDSITVTWTR